MSTRTRCRLCNVRGNSAAQYRYRYASALAVMIVWSYACAGAAATGLFTSAWCSFSYASLIAPSGSYPDTGHAELNDGVTGAYDSSGPSATPFVGWNRATTQSNVYVVLDMGWGGGRFRTLSHFRMYMAQSGRQGINVPQQVSYYYAAASSAAALSAVQPSGRTASYELTAWMTPRPAAYPAYPNGPMVLSITESLSALAGVGSGSGSKLQLTFSAAADYPVYVGEIQVTDSSGAAFPITGIDGGSSSSPVMYDGVVPTTTAIDALWVSLGTGSSTPYVQLNLGAASRAWGNITITLLAITPAGAQQTAVPWSATIASGTTSYAYGTGVQLSTSPFWDNTHVLRVTTSTIAPDQSAGLPVGTGVLADSNRFVVVNVTYQNWLFMSELVACWDPCTEYPYNTSCVGCAQDYLNPDSIHCDSCAAGFGGVNCQTDINECASAPCRNGATCVDGNNGFTCTCAAGYAGALCGTDYSECASNPCQHGGTCSEATINSFACACATGYSGVRCETDTDECASAPCQHGGTCSDDIGSFTCACVAGWTGALCQTDADDCASTPCAHAGTCTDGLNRFDCTCVAGYSGVRCETDVDECASTPCQHGATCVDGVNSYTCTCARGYEGVRCATDQDECASNPCRNGGSCVDGVASWTCTCALGFSGVSCQTNVNECSSAPCLNGATCVDGDGLFTCTCDTGFEGVLCATNLNECASNPCLHAATCVDGTNSFTCSCPPGFAGRICETDVNECASAPCANGGTCLDAINSFTCSCAVGWTGNRCQSLVDVCTSQPCRNGAGCVVGTGANGVPAGQFACTCVVGFEGVTCETDIDECASNPCHGTGTCVDGTNSFSCTCATGFGGHLCETVVSDCASLPCLNGGTCTDAVNAFSCACATGFSGAQCQTAISACASMPCQNGGTCVDAANGADAFTCSCTADWGNTTCQTAVRDCVLQPCQNGATCVDLSPPESGHTCGCVSGSGYIGVDCELRESVTVALLNPVPRNNSVIALGLSALSVVYGGGGIRKASVGPPRYCVITDARTGQQRQRIQLTRVSTVVGESQASWPVLASTFLAPLTLYRVRFDDGAFVDDTSGAYALAGIKAQNWLLTTGFDDAGVLNDASATVTVRVLLSSPIVLAGALRRSADVDALRDDVLLDLSTALQTPLSRFDAARVTILPADPAVLAASFPPTAGTAAGTVTTADTGSTTVPSIPVRNVTVTFVISGRASSAALTERTAGDLAAALQNMLADEELSTAIFSGRVTSGVDPSYFLFTAVPLPDSSTGGAPESSNLVLVLIVFGCIAAVVLLVLFVSARRWPASKPTAMVLFVLQLLSVYTMFAFIASLYGVSTSVGVGASGASASSTSETVDGTMRMYFWIALAAAAAAVLVNVTALSLLVYREMLRAVFSRWMEATPGAVPVLSFVAFFSALKIGCFNVMFSRFMGLEALSAPLTDFGQQKFKAVEFASLMIVDVPHLALQVLSTNHLHRWTTTTSLAFAMSIFHLSLSVIGRVFVCCKTAADRQRAARKRGAYHVDSADPDAVRVIRAADANRFATVTLQNPNAAPPSTAGLAAAVAAATAAGDYGGPAVGGGPKVAGGVGAVTGADADGVELSTAATATADGAPPVVRVAFAGEQSSSTVLRRLSESPALAAAARAAAPVLSSPAPLLRHIDGGSSNTAADASAFAAVRRRPSPPMVVAGPATEPTAPPLRPATATTPAVRVVIDKPKPEALAAAIAASGDADAAAGAGAGGSDAMRVEDVPATPRSA